MELARARESNLGEKLRVDLFSSAVSVEKRSEEDRCASDIPIRCEGRANNYLPAEAAWKLTRQLVAAHGIEVVRAPHAPV